MMVNLSRIVLPIFILLILGSCIQHIHKSQHFSGHVPDLTQSIGKQVQLYVSFSDQHREALAPVYAKDANTIISDALLRAGVTPSSRSEKSLVLDISYQKMGGLPLYQISENSKNELRLRVHYKVLVMLLRDHKTLFKNEYFISKNVAPYGSVPFFGARDTIEQRVWKLYEHSQYEVIEIFLNDLNYLDFRS